MSGFYEEDEMKLKFLLDMYRLVSNDFKENYENLKNIRINLRSLNSLNISAFTDVEFLDIINFDISDIIDVLFNTPLQLKKNKRFHELSDLCITELTDPIRRPRLIQMYLRDFLSETIKRIDSHVLTNGMVLADLGTASKLTSSMMYKIQQNIVDSVKKKKDEDEDEGDIDFDNDTPGEDT